MDSAPGFQCGFADEPGRWDHWPSKMVMCWPRSDGVNGTVVIAPGDVVFPFKEYVRSPVTLSIEEGRIADVAGNDVGVLIREFLESSRDRDAWLTSHMGWGLLETADWSALSMYDKESLMGMDARSYAGNFLMSTGPNPFLDRWTAYHLDIPMRGWLDRDRWSVSGGSGNGRRLVTRDAPRRSSAQRPGVALRA